MIKLFIFIYYQILLIIDEIFLFIIPELEWLLYYIVYIILITTFYYLYLKYNAGLGTNKIISRRFNIIKPNFCLPFKKSYKLSKFNFNTVYFSLILFRGIHNTTHLILHPWFITGFTDAEGCFFIGITKRTGGYRANLQFIIKLHKRDIAIIWGFKAFFKDVGNVYPAGVNSYEYRVTSISAMSTIISHFENYPLVSQKRTDFEFFKSAWSIFISNNHLSILGLKKIVSFKASMNNGLSDSLKVIFSDVTPASKPSIEYQKIPNNIWLSAFSSGEGYFGIHIRGPNSINHIFSIGQHKRDAALLKSFEVFFKCGYYYPHPKLNSGEYRCTNRGDILNNIIPFFQENPIIGVKALDFKDWSRIIIMVQNGEHKTNVGMAKIKTIKEGMRHYS